MKRKTRATASRGGKSPKASGFRAGSPHRGVSRPGIPAAEASKGTKATIAG